MYAKMDREGQREGRKDGKWGRGKRERGRDGEWGRGKRERGRGEREDGEREGWGEVEGEIEGGHIEQLTSCVYSEDELNILKVIEEDYECE